MWAATKLQVSCLPSHPHQDVFVRAGKAACSRDLAGGTGWLSSGVRKCTLALASSSWWLCMCSTLPWPPGLTFGYLHGQVLRGPVAGLI